MNNVFVMSVVSFFALYGIIQLVKNIFLLFTNPRDDFYLIIKVKNQQDSVEYLIRDAIWRNLGRHRFIPRVYIVDNDSTDDTINILRRLEREYEFITVLTKDEYILLMENDI